MAAKYDDVEKIVEIAELKFKELVGRHVTERKAQAELLDMLIDMMDATQDTANASVRETFRRLVQVAHRRFNGSSIDLSAVEMRWWVEEMRKS